MVNLNTNEIQSDPEHLHPTVQSQVHHTMCSVWPFATSEGFFSMVTSSHVPMSGAVNARGPINIQTLSVGGHRTLKVPLMSSPPWSCSPGTSVTPAEFIWPGGPSLNSSQECFCSKKHKKDFWLWWVCFCTFLIPVTETSWAKKTPGVLNIYHVAIRWCTSCLLLCLEISFCGSFSYWKCHMGPLKDKTLQTFCWATSSLQRFTSANQSGCGCTCEGRG